MATRLRDYLNNDKSDVTQASLICGVDPADSEIYPIELGPDGESLKVTPLATTQSGEVVSLQATENGATNVGNAYKKFRDGFASLAQDAAPDPAVWTGSWTNQGGSFAGRRGNAAGSAYLSISLCPITVGSEYVLESVENFRYPMRFAFGVSISQRIIGQEIEASIVGTDGSVVEVLTPKADIAISGSISVTTNVATVNFATPHDFVGGDRVILKGNTDSRMNVGPVSVTVISPVQITIPLSIANASYTAGGFVQWLDPFKYAQNAVGLVWENVIATQGTFYTRRNGYNTRGVNSSITTTTATQSSTSSYSDGLNAAGRFEFKCDQEESVLTPRGQDSVAAPPSTVKWTQGIPDEEKQYKLRFRVRNNENLTVPVAKIVSATKTGTTTATIVTSTPHGLNALDQVQIYGIRDATSFPALIAQTAIASIVDATTFTIIIGAALTVSSTGGSVHRVNGINLAPGAVTQSIQSVARTSNVMTVIGSAAWTVVFPGDNVNIYGCDATSMGLYDGVYKVLRFSGTTLELESVGPDFGTINCGGTVLKRTDSRLHFVNQMEYTRHVVELSQQNGGFDQSRTLPVAAFINSGTVTTVTTVTAGGVQIPINVADIASAVIAVTATTVAVTPAQGVAYQVNIPVTAASGTNPTLDVSIEESDDSGTNWFKVYDFPRITTTGMYRSPVIQSSGNRIRYVQTVGGATPSFTRSLNRLQIHNDAQYLRQLVDRTIVPITLNSTSGSLFVSGASNFNLFVRCTAQTTPATIALQFSHDGTNWHTSATTVATINGIAQAKVSNEKWSFVRAIVTAGGTGITLGELQIIGSDN